jgi:hypothetical protein
VCGGLDRLHRRHAVLDHERKLASRDTVRTDARIGTERHFHSRASCFGEALALRFTKVPIVLEKISRRAAFFSVLLDALLVVDVHVQIGPPLFGERDAFVVYERGVLDGSDAGADGVLDSFRRVRMRFDAQGEVFCFVHGGL